MLHYAYPPQVQRNFIDNARVFSLDVVSIARPRCHGIQISFYVGWVLRVFALPVAGLLLIGLRCPVLVKNATQRGAPQSYAPRLISPIIHV